ncbi:MAG TPA: neutral zinc metallopeptidase [Blastocatellia bacterium]|nr:neutral zinc metallopeptidase [Blastocatellia bacterium]
MKNWTLRISAMLILPALLFTSSLSTNKYSGATAEYFAQPGQVYASTNEPPTQYEMRQVAIKANSAVKFLDTFWRQTFAAHNLSYTSPRISASGPAPIYYSPTDTIYIAPNFLALQMRDAAARFGTDGDFAFIVILAHEWGHAIQKRLGLTAGPTIYRELQADCLAGAFAKAARTAGALDPGDIDEAVFAFLMARDSTGTNPNHPNAHGTGEQRIRAFHLGLDGGVKSCGCF